MEVGAPTVDVTQAPIEAGTPWALILLAAAGVGAVVLMGGKGKRKSRAKK
jgi:ribose/xylose/arabinose/galactoside ABC-type transport system permease subunit